MKVLVAGGAGYIGSHIVQVLLDAGHEPTTFDADQLERLAQPLLKSGYGQYLMAVVRDRVF